MERVWWTARYSTHLASHALSCWPARQIQGAETAPGPQGRTGWWPWSRRAAQGSATSAGEMWIFATKESPCINCNASLAKMGDERKCLCALWASAIGLAAAGVEHGQAGIPRPRTTPRTTVLGGGLAAYTERAGFALPWFKSGRC